MPPARKDAPSCTPRAFAFLRDWFEAAFGADAAALALGRVSLALVLLKDLAHRAALAAAFLSDDGALPRGFERATRADAELARALFEDGFGIGADALPLARADDAAADAAAAELARRGDDLWLLPPARVRRACVPEGLRLNRIGVRAIEGAAGGGGGGTRARGRGGGGGARVTHEFAKAYGRLSPPGHAGRCELGAADARDYLRGRDVRLDAARASPAAAARACSCATTGSCSDSRRSSPRRASRGRTSAGST